MTEELAVFIGAEAPSGSTSGTVMLSPDGEKPAGVIVETQQVTVVVTAVDANKHKVTFRLPDGSTKKVKVSDELDLSTVTIGESLTIVVSEGLAITVTAP